MFFCHLGQKQIAECTGHKNKTNPRFQTSFLHSIVIDYITALEPVTIGCDRSNMCMGQLFLPYLI